MPLKLLLPIEKASQCAKSLPLCTDRCEIIINSARAFLNHGYPEFTRDMINHELECWKDAPPGEALHLLLTESAMILQSLDSDSESIKDEILSLLIRSFKIAESLPEHHPDFQEISPRNLSLEKTALCFYRCGEKELSETAVASINGDDRIGSLIKIAVECEQNLPGAFSPLVEKAVNEALRILDRDWKSEELLNIAIMLSAAGEEDWAREILEDSFEEACRVKDPLARTSLLAGIAACGLDLLTPDDNDDRIMLTRNQALKISNTVQRVDLLLDVASLFLQLGLKKECAETVMEIPELSQPTVIEDHSFYLRAAKLLVKSDFPEKAALMAENIHYSGNPSDIQDFCRKMISAAEIYFLSGSDTKTQNTLVQAAELTGKIQKPWNQLCMMGGILEAALDFKIPTDEFASKIIDILKTNESDIPDPIMNGIASLLARCGHQDKALSLTGLAPDARIDIMLAACGDSCSISVLSEIEKLARMISDTEDQILHLAQIAWRYRTLGNNEQCCRLIDLIIDSSEQLNPVQRGDLLLECYWKITGEII